MDSLQQDAYFRQRVLRCAAQKGVREEQRVHF